MSKNKQLPPDKAHLVKGSDYLLSLSSIVGKPIVDVHGYITGEFNLLNFQITKIVFADGKTEPVNGEHDCAYIPQPAEHKELRDKNLAKIDPEASEAIEYDDNDDPDDES
jgi:hypothetical protein